MTAIIHIVLPMFALIALGYYAGRSRAFTNVMVQGVSRFVGLYALPALLFAAMMKAHIPDPIEWGFVGAFFIAAYAVFAVGSGWMWWLRRREDIAPVGFATSFSSIGLLGVPIILDAYGPSVAIPVMLLICFQSPLLFTCATMLAEVQRTSGGRPLPAALAAIKATVLSPMILSIVLGLGVNLFQIPMPDVVTKAVGLAAQTVLPCSCFTLGATLAFSPAAGNVLPATIMAVLKTIVHPALTWLLAVEVFHLPPDWLAPAVTAAALPIGINAFAFAERYQASRELVSMSLLISTILSPVSISVAFMVSMG